MNRVKKLVYEMLTENTGKHMCDSGFAEGRGWQKNQKKTIDDFNNEDEEIYTFDFERGDIERTVSVFHFLTNDLELDDICNEFNKIQDESDDWDADCEANGVSRNAYDHIDAFWDVKIESTWNTYNGESDLSQILQGADITIDEDEYVLIQIHNGADARGGYTDAKLFKCEDGMIHQYLSKWKDSGEIDDDIEDGYIDTFLDYDKGDAKTYTSQDVKDRIAEISSEKRKAANSIKLDL